MVWLLERTCRWALRANTTLSLQSLVLLLLTSLCFGVVADGESELWISLLLLKRWRDLGIMLKLGARRHLGTLRASSSISSRPSSIFSRPSSISSAPLLPPPGKCSCLGTMLALLETWDSAKVLHKRGTRGGSLRRMANMLLVDGVQGILNTDYGLWTLGLGIWNMEQRIQ